MSFSMAFPAKLKNVPMSCSGAVFFPNFNMVWMISDSAAKSANCGRNYFFSSLGSIIAITGFWWEPLCRPWLTAVLPPADSPTYLASLLRSVLYTELLYYPIFYVFYGDMLRQLTWFLRLF